MLNVSKVQLLVWQRGTDIIGWKPSRVRAIQRARRVAVERMFKGEIDVLGVGSNGLLDIRLVPRKVQASRKRRKAQRRARRQTRLH